MGAYYSMFYGLEFSLSSAASGMCTGLLLTTAAVRKQSPEICTGMPLTDAKLKQPLSSQLGFVVDCLLFGFQPQPMNPGKTFSPFCWAAI